MAKQETLVVAGSSERMLSPYYLSSSDNRGVSISPVSLNGENYAEWASELENALRAKRKTGFIDGSLKMPDQNEKPVEAGGSRHMENGELYDRWMDPSFHYSCSALYCHLHT